MTVVAYKKGIISCDSQVTVEGHKWASSKKIKKVDGWLLGAAGNWDMLTHFFAKFDPKNMEKGRAYSPINPAPSKGEFEGLAISPKGKIYYIDDSGIFGEIGTKGFIAIGSGTIPAMVAMELGQSSLNAVKLTCKHITTCGGRIYSLKL